MYLTKVIYKRIWVIMYNVINLDVFTYKVYIKFTLIFVTYCLLFVNICRTFIHRENNWRLLPAFINQKYLSGERGKAGGHEPPLFPFSATY